MKLLLLEDDEILAEIIEEYLLSLGYDVVLCKDGESAEERLYSTRYDLLILDVNVPVISGFELVQNLRERNITTPAIFITSLHTTKDLEKGFAVGGDDYIKKPFELEELRVRIENIKRLYHIEPTSKEEIFEGVFFDRNNLLLRGEKIATKEAKILEYLLKNKERLVTAEEILSNVWSFQEAPTAVTLRTYIKNLRKVLGTEAIETVKGVGYRLNQ